MKLKEIRKSAIPTVVANGNLPVKDVTIDALENTGVGLITYGLNPGDVFEFPTSEEDMQFKERTVREGARGEMLILGLKNGKPAWFSVANLRRRNYKMEPVYPLAADLNRCENDAVRIRQCLGKKIIAEEMVTYQEYRFVDGVRTDELRDRTVASLRFMDEDDE